MELELGHYVRADHSKDNILRVCQLCSSSLSILGNVWVLWHTWFKSTASSPFKRPHVRLSLIVMLAWSDPLAFIEVTLHSLRHL